MVQILHGAGTSQVAAVVRDLQVVVTGAAGNIVEAEERADNVVVVVAVAEEVVLPGAAECGLDIVGVGPLPAEQLRGSKTLAVKTGQKVFEIEVIEEVSWEVGFVVAQVVEHLAWVEQEA